MMSINISIRGYYGVCQKEINEKTTLSFSYTPVKRGRKVVAIKFDVKPQIEAPPVTAPESAPEDPTSEPVPEVPKFEIPDFVSTPMPDERSDQPCAYSSEFCEEDTDYEEPYLDGSEKYSSDEIVFLASACDFEFTEVQMMEIIAIVCKMDFIKVEYEHYMGVEFSRYDYLEEQYLKLNVYAEKNRLSGERRFFYFRKMLKNDRLSHQFGEVD